MWANSATSLLRRAIINATHAFRNGFIGMDLRWVQAGKMGYFQLKMSSENLACSVK